MVPSARSPYTSAVNEVVSGAVAIQENPAIPEKRHNPKAPVIPSVANARYVLPHRSKPSVKNEF
jgi:hypothetical protein